MLARIELLPVQRFHSICIQHLLFFACFMTFQLHNLACFIRIDSFIFSGSSSESILFFFALLNFLYFVFVLLFLFSLRTSRPFFSSAFSVQRGSLWRSGGHALRGSCASLCFLKGLHMLAGIGLLPVQRFHSIGIQYFFLLVLLLFNLTTLHIC